MSSNSFFSNMGVYSDRVLNIKQSATLQVASAARELKSKGFKVVDMSIGELDFDTPKAICSEAKNSIDHGKTKYTEVAGIKELRELVAKHVSKYSGCDFSFKNVCINSGAKQSLFNVFMALLNEGDEVIIPKPFWVSFPDMVELAGGKSIFCNYDKSDFTIDLDHLESLICPKTKILILNFPNNPSGACYNEEKMSKLVKIIQKHKDLIVLSDDTYMSFVYDGKFVSVLSIDSSLSSRTIITNSFSKSFSMTGWRVGYIVADENLIAKASLIQSQSTSCPCSISQYAALSALKDSYDEPYYFLSILKKRRDTVFSYLAKVSGLDIKKPDGAFYFFISCQPLVDKEKIKDDLEFAKILIERYSVAVVPGSAFGVSNYFRIAYSLDETQLIEGCKKIANACEDLLLDR